MCGIAGLSLKRGQADEQQLILLAEGLRHRGPDGQGTLIEGGNALAHRRLSIIDVAGGAQPISDAEQKTHIVGNSEIYNYHALQTQLARKGIALKTKSDTETALHLYRLYGLDFVDHLRGMYGLAIYDGTADRIVLARDPFGIKPLYYAETDQGVAFASEPSAMVHAGWCRATVNEAALPQLLNRHYVAGRQTMFSGIERVLPGELLVIERGKIVQRRRRPPRLWMPDRADTDWMSAFDDLFTESTSAHLQSDGPCGAFLSGGVDSSALVLKMSEVTEDLRTYSIGYDSTAVYDERCQAARLAEKINSKHEELSFGEEDFWAYLPVMCTALDDLVADYAALPLLKLAQIASRSVKVVLLGEGGDEIFAGYGRYRIGLRDRLFRRAFRGNGDAARFADLFRIDAVLPAADPPLFDTSSFTDLQKRQAQDIADWLTCDLLLKVDRCLMAYGVEGRVPYLDDRLAAFGFSLPDRLKVRMHQGKWLVKQWLAQRYPAANVWQRKRGFTVPVRDWLEKRRAGIAEYLCTQDGVRGIVYCEKLQALLGRPLQDKSAKLLFTLLCFGVWHDIHILGSLQSYNSLLKTSPEEGYGQGLSALLLGGQQPGFASSYDSRFGESSQTTL